MAAAVAAAAARRRVSVGAPASLPASALLYRHAVARAPQVQGAAPAAAASAAPPRRELARAAFHAEPFGIVASAAGEAIVVAGLTAARPHAVVCFSGGGVGLVVDMRTDGTLTVALLAGPAPVATETVALEPSPLAVPVHSGLTGRVVDALGAPIDGRGALAPPAAAPTAAPSAWPVFGCDVAGIAERAAPRHTIDTGFKALNAAYPLVVGRSHLLTGERGVGKSHLAAAIVGAVSRANRDAAAASVARLAVDGAPLWSGDTAHAVHCVYVVVGASASTLSATLTDLAAAGALQYTTVVAAPAGATAAMRYLAPFTGAAMADAAARAGRHALLVVDDLSDHFAAARTISGVDWLRTEATPTGHAALFDRAAQLSDAAGGGSLTLLAVAHSVPSGTAYSQMSHIKERQHVGHLCGIADTVIPLSTAATRAATLPPLEFGDLVVRTGHISQGEALRHYVTRLQLVMTQLREAARSAVASAAMGVEREADTDGILDLHTKTRLLLLPTAKAVKAARARWLGAADVAAVGLDGMVFTGAADDVGGSSSGGGSGGSSGGGSGSGGSGSNISSNSGGSGRSGNPLGVPSSRGMAAINAMVADRSRRVRSASVEDAGAGHATPAPAAAVAAAPPAKSASGRVPFRAPQVGSRPAAEQTFAALATAPVLGAPPATLRHARLTLNRDDGSLPAALAAAAGAAGDGIDPLLAARAAAATAAAAGGGSQFQLGDPARTLLTLFLVTHTYVQRVPLHRLAAYEDGLWRLVSQLPFVARADADHAPRADAADAPGVLGDDLAAYLADGTGALSLPVLHLPHGAVGTSVIHAALATAVGVDVRNAPPPDVRWQLQQATLALAAQAAVSAAEAAARRAAAAPSPPPPPSSTPPSLTPSSPASSTPSPPAGGLWSRFAGALLAKPARPTEPQPAVLAPAVATPPPPPPPPRDLTPDEAAARLLSRYVRLDGGQSLEHLPLPWQALHIVVADYTRRFCGEPL